MEVIQAKSAGFCFGVARAVKMAPELAEADPRPRMLGSVIHNRHVTAALAEGGMEELSSPDQAQAGDREAALAAHKRRYEQAMYIETIIKYATDGGKRP